MTIENKINKTKKKQKNQNQKLLQLNTSYNQTIGNNHSITSTTTSSIGTTIPSSIPSSIDTSNLSTTTSNSNNYKKINDLKEYLSNWENRKIIQWKFNKILQGWAISNLFNKEVIDSKVFKQLCLYLVTLQGNARVRLLEQINQIIKDAELQVEDRKEEGEGGGEEDGEGNNGEDGKVSKKVLKRAIKLKKLLDI